MQFLQILCWILLPALVLATILTAFFHYRKKRLERAEDADIKGSPEIVGYTRGDGEFICFDHSPLINDYKKRLTYSHARVTALKKDLNRLQQRYDALAGYTIQWFSAENPKAKIRVQTMPAPVRKEIERIAMQFDSDKKDREKRMQALSDAYRSLEEENKDLQDRLNIGALPADEKDALLIEWQEKNSRLNEKLAEQQWLQSVLDEKNAQLQFLRHKIEHELRLSAEIADRNVLLSATNQQLLAEKELSLRYTEQLKEELLKQKSETGKLQFLLNEQESIIKESEQPKLHAQEEEIQPLQTGFVEGTLPDNVAPVPSPVIVFNPSYLRGAGGEMAVH